MREIEFRASAQDEETGRIVWIYYVPFQSVLTMYIPSGYVLTDIANLQYAGIKDKNGKKIYEGDIMKVPDLYETPENTSMTYNNQVVEFKNFSFQLGDSPMGEDYEYISDECEVIGNIYENPELLEVPHDR